MSEHLDAVQKAARQVMARYDFNEHGGAPLLWTLSEPFGARAWEHALELAVPAKVLEVNQRAFALGREAAAAT